MKQFKMSVRNLELKVRSRRITRVRGCGVETWCYLVVMGMPSTFKKILFGRL